MEEGTGSKRKIDRGKAAWREERIREEAGERGEKLASTLSTCNLGKREKDFASDQYGVG